MFKDKPLYVKLIVLLFSYIVAGLLGYFTYYKLITSTSILWCCILAFILTWIIIFGAFILFQNFKYLRFPATYYKKRAFESKAYFNRLGVPIVRWVIINSFFKLLNQRVYLRGENADRFIKFIEETKQSETSHMLSFIATLIVQVLLIINDKLMVSLILFIFNIIFNIYPVLLQRMNRFSVEITKINKQ